MANIYASCVAFGDDGVLILGESGSGKSDLALRLINDGAKLVADDRCEVFNQNQILIAKAPETIKGLIEARGIGIIKLEYQEQAEIKLVIRLSTQDKIQRLPEIKTSKICDIDIKEFLLYPFEVSTTAKIKLVLKIATNQINIIK